MFMTSAKTTNKKELQNQTQSKMTSSQPEKYFIAGNIAGMLGVVAGQPFDTIKVRMQTAKRRVVFFPYQKVSIYTGPLHCSQIIFRKFGIRGFYKGMTAPIIAVGAQKAVAFGVFGNTRQHLENQFPGSILNTSIAGAVGGMANSFILCPVDQIKIASQVQGNNLSVFATIQHLVVQNGNIVTGLWRTIPVVFMREIPGYCIYFTNYELLNRTFNSSSFLQKHPILCKFFLGGMAGVGMWALYYPLDLIKSRVQAQQILGGKQHNILETIKKVWKDNGIRGFYRGITPAVVRAFPTHSTVFLTYELVLQLWN